MGPLPPFHWRGLLFLTALAGRVLAQVDLQPFENKCKCIGSVSLYQYDKTLQKSIFGTERIEGLYFKSRRRSSSSSAGIEGEWSRYSRSNYNPLESFPEDYGTFCAEWDPEDIAKGTKWCFVEKTEGCDLEADTVTADPNQCQDWDQSYDSTRFNFQPVSNPHGAPYFRRQPPTPGTGSHPPAYISGDRVIERDGEYCKDDTCKFLYISTIPCGSNQCKKEICAPKGDPPRTSVFQKCEEDTIGYPCGNNLDKTFYHGVLFWAGHKIIETEPVKKSQFAFQGGVEPFVYDMLPTDTTGGIGEPDVQDRSLNGTIVRQGPTLRVLADSVVHINRAPIEMINEKSKDYPCDYETTEGWQQIDSIAITRKMPWSELKIFLESSESDSTAKYLLHTSYTAQNSSSISTGLYNSAVKWSFSSNLSENRPLTIDTTVLCSFQSACPESNSTHCVGASRGGPLSCYSDTGNDGSSYWYVTENCLGTKQSNWPECAFGKLEVHPHECPATMTTSNLSPSQTESAIRNATANMLTELNMAEKRCGDYMRQKIRDAVNEKSYDSLSNAIGDTKKYYPYLLGMYTIRDFCRFNLEKTDPVNSANPTVDYTFPAEASTCDRTMCCEDNPNCDKGGARVTTSYPEKEYRECVLELGAYKRCSSADKQAHANLYFDDANGFLKRFRGWCPITECALGPLCGKYFDDCQQDLACKAAFDFAFKTHKDCDFQNVACREQAWKEAFRRYDLAYGTCGKYNPLSPSPCFSQWPDDSDSIAVKKFNGWYRCQKDCEAGNHQQHIVSTVRATLTSSRESGRAFEGVQDGASIQWTPSAQHRLCYRVAGLSGAASTPTARSIERHKCGTEIDGPDESYFKVESSAVEYSIFDETVEIQTIFKIRGLSIAGFERFPGTIRKKFPMSGSWQDLSSSATNFNDGDLTHSTGGTTRTVPSSDRFIITSISEGADDAKKRRKRSL